MLDATFTADSVKIVLHGGVEYSTTIFRKKMSRHSEETFLIHFMEGKLRATLDRFLEFDFSPLESAPDMNMLVARLKWQNHQSALIGKHSKKRFQGWEASFSKLGMPVTRNVSGAPEINYHVHV